MRLRFHRSFKIASGVTLNVSKSGLGSGIPGTGLSAVIGFALGVGIGIVVLVALSAILR